ncbi:hypothetical protein BUALT_Bualt14G0038000 [Buddleja alternifolia]|uniref:Nuclease HARBI1 n=1 Tax=Buddleja alternifolia TaxID=168488 RepID=A0AAV6WEL7_9LAMI|nr:hypothetical protein BUALT_Bualt14G0038000 [Buddleja alternifolia]
MILACALLHNFTHRKMEVDPTEAHVPENHQETYNDDQPVEVDYVESIHSSNEWSMWLDNLANELVGWNSTTKMIETDDDESWETACKNEPNARTMRYKSWPYYDSWCEVFGKDRVVGTGAEDFHNALNGILHTESHPKSPHDTHLDDNDMPYTSLVDDGATTSVCQAGSSTTTKARSSTTTKFKHVKFPWPLIPLLHELGNEIIINISRPPSRIEINDGSTFGVSMRPLMSFDIILSVDDVSVSVSSSRVPTVSSLKVRLGKGLGVA